MGFDRAGGDGTPYPRAIPGLSRVVRRGAARRDLVDIIGYFLGEGSPGAARRFRNQAEALFQQLASMPGLGTRYQPDLPALTDLRFLPISRFKKYLVFYRPIDDGIEVVRVLHGARDIQGILAAEFGLETGEDEAPGEDE